MRKRYLSIWFRYLKSDWFTIRRPELKDVPFVLIAADHGRMVIQAANSLAAAEDLEPGMAVADARAVVPELQVIDDRPGLSEKLLKGIAEWCIRYTPDVAVDAPDGLLLDITGCPHLWGGEMPFITDVVTRLTSLGYHVHAAIADTVGAAWALARFGKEPITIADPGGQHAALLDLPPKALRLEQATLERLHKLGLKQIGQFIHMPRATLQKRFGPHFIMRLHQALGLAEEHVQHFQPAAIFQERLPCLSPIVTATGIEIALQELLQKLCGRLQKQEKGIRKACLKGFRVDGKIETINIGTHRPSHNVEHLFKLFELHISSVEPALGIELFLLDALQVEELVPMQEGLWKPVGGLQSTQVAELLDRLSGKIGHHCIHRYLPYEHYLPELSFRKAVSIQETPEAEWRLDRPRPLHLLKVPEPIEVTAPIPDYPPMLFRRKGQLHKVVSADGPERIEQAWWLQPGEHRDYYILEDEQGQRYWIFRLGHYRGDQSQQWFIHGFFP
jgi:protein ImuB